MKTAFKEKNMIKRTGLLIICILILCLFLSSCKKNNIAARVGEYVFTKEDLKEALKDVSEKKREKKRLRILDDLVKARVYADEARKAGLQRDPKVLSRMSRVRGEVLAKVFVQKHIIEASIPSEEMIKKYYHDPKNHYIVPESFSVLHLEYRDKKRARNVIKRINRGKSMEWLAKVGSRCSCSSRKGHHKKLYKGKMDPEMEEAVMDLKAGELSGLIKINENYHIVRLLKRHRGTSVSLEDAKEKIKMGLMSQNRNSLYKKYYDQAGINYSPSEKGILVQIGDEKIPESRILPLFAKSTDKKQVEKVKKEWIKYFVDKKVFSDAAKKAGLEKDPRFLKKLEWENDRILADAYFKKFISKRIAINEKKIEEFYRQNIKDYTSPLRVRTKIIQVKTESEAEEILGKLKKGEYFTAVASKRSLHPSAKRSGAELGWFSRGESEPEIEKAAFSLKKGELSGIIKTGGLYSIIKLIDIMEPKATPLIHIKDRIKMRLIDETKEKIKSEFYKKAGVKIFLS